MRKRDKGGSGRAKRQRFGQAWSQREIRGKRVAQSECYCLRLNVSKAKMMMPGKAGGPPGYLAVSAARGAHSKMPT